MKAIIITLTDRVERAANAARLLVALGSQGISGEILVAETPNTYQFREIDYAASKSLEQPMLAREISCSWSHYLAYRRIIEMGEPALILEDDAYLLNPIGSVDFEGVEHVMGCSRWSEADHHDPFEVLETEPTRQLVRGLPYGTQCYYVTVEGARLLLEHLLPIRWACDLALGRLSSQGLIKTYLSTIPLAVQHPDIESSIGIR